VKSTICLVEDEMLLRETTREDLEDLGYEVIAAVTCEEAWTLLSEGTKVHCLLTDIRTPGPIDGWELARRARELRPELGVIYVSGYSGGEARPVNGGIFLPKPYHLRDLERALANLAG
jgi:CheY-like chemotaxis protein